ncbi:myotubularin-related protein 11 isoform X3 [Pezoporus occidentalis]|uniref:myotubularin-related protein 11 isoform X3 n=1 Tax=Pezoporus occidentalis TaxID=407982 RepID=UPI002F9132FA
MSGRRPAFPGLPGELVLEEAAGARQRCGSDGSVPGTLLCTNRRVAFVPAQGPGSPRPFLPSEHEVALPCIRKLVAASSFTKPKVLTGASTLKFIPEELALFCRDFRLLRFHFHENGLAPQAFRVANAIAQAREEAAWLGDAGEGCDGARPGDDEGEDEEDEESEDGSSATLLFESLRDWEKELKRQGAAGWRVSAVNERFDMAPSASAGTTRAAAPCSEPPPSTRGRSRAARTRGAAAEEKWLSALEGTRWLDHVRSCLRKAVEVASLLAGRRCTVLLQEPSDRDLNCLLASLVQLLGDPHSRTLPGFQSLLQREWVAAGHPFPHRLGLLRCDSPWEEAPVFLLFLDCTWQLVRQFPAAFGFTEAYLLALHDSSFTPYFSTFLFSCQRQRGHGSLHRPRSQSYHPVSGGREPGSTVLPEVWEWGLRYSRQQRERFRNPAGAALGTPGTAEPQPNPASPWPGAGPGPVFLLTKGALSAQPLPWRGGRPPPHRSRWAPSLESLGEPGGGRPPLGLLLPCAAGPSVRLWARCYLRGLPEAQRGRFAPSPAGLAEELLLLQDRLSALTA